LQITQHDLAKALDISQTTLQRIEAGVSSDINTLKCMQILLKFPEVALWQLKQTGNQVHKDVSTKLIKYFQSKVDNISSIKNYLLYAYKKYQSIANKKTLAVHGSFQLAFAINNSFERLVISEIILNKLKSS
jgi:DNA-binding XRE family transcriptional regulator